MNDFNKRLWRYLNLVFMCIVLVGFKNNLQAQNTSTQTVRGIVVDAENDYPLFGATIQFITISSVQPIGTTTDENGRFELENIPIGRQAFKCSYIGYSEQIISNYLVVQGKEGYLAGQTHLKI